MLQYEGRVKGVPAKCGKLLYASSFQKVRVSKDVVVA